MAHRARVFDLLAAGDLAGMDAEILAFSRLAEPLRMPGYLWWAALWSAMRALLEGRHDVAETRAVAAYEVGKSTFPMLSLFNLSFQLFFLRREQGRLDEMEAATREYAASRVDVPAIRVALTFLLAELGRLDEARATLNALDHAALDATPRSELARVVVSARSCCLDRRRGQRCRNVARTAASPDGGVHPGLTRHGVSWRGRPRYGLVTPDDRRCR